MRKLTVPLLVAVVAATGGMTLGAGSASAKSASSGSTTQANRDMDNVATGRTDIARCAPITNRSFTGTITGADGLYPNATIGFDVLDSAGRIIDIATGCPTRGYSAIVQVNHFIDAHGAAPGTEMFNEAHPYNPVKSQGLVTNEFKLLNLPANATVAWVETWSRRYTGSPCGLGCAGQLDNSKYGMVNRRAVKLSTGQLNIVLPITPEFGGTTGKIRLSVRNKAGKPVALKKIYAWSTLRKDGSKPFQGWGIGRPVGNGIWEVPALAPGQTYVLWLYAPDGSVIRRKADVPVKAKFTTKIRVTV